MWLSRFCRSVQMWMQNDAVWRCLLCRAAVGGSNVCDSFKHTQIPQANVPLHFHQSQNHIQSKANQVLSMVRRGEKQGSYLNLFLLKSMKILQGQFSLVWFVRKIKLSFFINWEIRLNPTKPQTQKIFSWSPSSIYPFTTCDFSVSQNIML